MLPKNLCCPNHFVEQLWHLINTGAVAGYSAVPAALLLNFCHLLKNCDWTEKTSGPSICSRYPFTTASWFIVKFYNLIQAISLSALAIYVYTINLLLSAVYQNPQRERLKGRSAEFCPRSVAFVYRPFLFRQGSEVNSFL